MRPAIRESELVEQTTAEDIPATMSLEELCWELGIGSTACYERAKTDTLPVPVIRIGKLYRISRKAFARLLSATHDDPVGGGAS